MPRKKSSAKKAKELEEREKKQPQQVEKPQDEQMDTKESEDGSSSSEEEDEFGELVTEDVEDGINKVLTALRSGNTQQLLNPEAKFFEDPEKAAEIGSNKERHKPVYLKDYHRMNILSGQALQEDEDENANENGTVDGKQSYASQQNEERSEILKEINEAFNGNENDEDDKEEEGDELLVKKENKTSVPEVKLPNPEENGEEFLKAFDSNQAWIPRKSDELGDKTMEEDDDAFDDAVENFENAYNFRFEDPNSSNIVSYARNQATLRRSDTSARRRKRDESKQQKQAQQEEKEKTLHRKKTDKVRKLTDVLEQLQKEYGKTIDPTLVEKITNTLMNSEFKVEEWDKVVTELFDSEFYSDEGKPTWDEDDEIMGDFYKGNAQEEEEYQEVQEDAERNGSEGEDHPDADQPPKKKAKKEKQEKKKSKKQLQEAVEGAVEHNKLALIDEVEEDRKPRARTKEEQDVKFRYREVSPESFGLTARDIFAADDSELNKYIGLKKFAPYRPKEQKMKDKRKAAKPRRLKEWRKEVFNNEDGPVLDAQAQEDQTISQKKGSKRHKHK